jgi:hypothetical protein
MADFNSSLPIRTENSGDVVARLVDGTVATQALSIDTNGKITSRLNDGSGASVTLGQKLMTASLPVVLASDSSPLAVTQAVTAPTTPINAYNSTINLAANVTVSHVYTVGATRTFYGRQFLVSGSGKLRADVQTSVNGTVWMPVFVLFNSAAEPTMILNLGSHVTATVGTGSAVRIQITNQDKQAFDVYSTISGYEL